MGPNEGKTFLEQTKCVARALTARNPYLFDLGQIYEEKSQVYQYENKISLIGKWTKGVDPTGNWYILKASEWSGKSQRTLPRGETCEATFHCSEKEANRTVELFRAAVNQLEKDFVVSDFIQNLPDESISANPVERVEIDRKTIENLKGTLNAINPDFNQNKIIKFRNWLEQLTQTHEVVRINLGKYPADVNHFLNVHPKHLIAFSEHLAAERVKHCVDAHLFGSVATTVDVCGFVAKKDAEANPCLLYTSPSPRDRS